MSSTGRKPKTTDTGDEFYPTPRWTIQALMESPAGRELPGGLWIEPCAGTGRIVDTINGCRKDVSWLISELHDQFDSFLKPLARPGRDFLNPYGDFVHGPWPHGFAEVLIMNPPFSLTMDFVLEAMKRAMWVVCLQRQGWFGTKGRSPWLINHCPDIRQLPERPSFRPDGSTDSCEYCWFIWPPNSAAHRSEGTVSMLPMPDGGQQMLF